MRALFAVSMVLLTGCISVQRPVVEGYTCGEGTVVHGNECRAVVQRVYGPVCGPGTIQRGHECVVDTRLDVRQR